MFFRQSLYPLLAALAFGLALLGFINGHDLHLGTFRSYGTTTDIMPHKETLFFIAVAFLGTGMTWFATLFFARAAGDKLLRLGRRLLRNKRATVAGLAAFSLIATAAVSWLALQHATVLLDEDCYRFQVELLRAGKLYTTVPVPLDPFREFYSVQTNDIWTGIYPWGHVIALLPGYVLGMPHLVPHLCAPIAVVMTYLLGRELFPEDEVTPLIGSAVVALSPFVAFTCGSTHNVTTSLVLVTTGLWGLTRAVSRSSFWAALIAGLAFGTSLHSRPLNAVSIGAMAGLVALIASVKLRRPTLRLLTAFFVGLAPGIVAYGALNLYITGDVFLTPARLSAPESVRLFGFGAGLIVPHTPLLAFGKAGTNLLRTVMWTSGSLVAALGTLAFVAGLRRRESDLMLLVPILSSFGCYYFFFTSPGYDTGPLYYLDLVPLFGLILGRVLVALFDRLPTCDEQPLRLASAAALASVLVSFSTFWPMEAIAARRVTDNNLMPYRAVENAGIHNAVVWHERNPNYKSWNLPPRPPKPDLSDDVLYARNEATSGLALWKKLKNKRTFYKLVFEDEGAVVRVVPWYPDPSSSTRP